MRKYLVLSVISSTVLIAGGDIAPVKPVVAVGAAEADYGDIFGQSRTFYIDRTYSGGTNNNRNSLATGGYIGYKSPDFHGLTVAVEAYGTYGFEIHDNSIEDDFPGWANYDPSLTGYEGENYAFIGEAYINYAFDNTNIKVGRQRLDTPLAGADDARMLPNLFEAAVLSNIDIENTTLIAAHITKETVGTFGNIYGGSILGVNSGYGLGMKNALSGDFVDMGEVALGSGNNTDGVTAGAVIYKGIEGLTLTAWDYYAHDILNALYLQADYGWSCRLNDSVKMNASAQYINERDAGNALGGKVDSNYWGAKLGVSSGILSGYVAYSQTGDSDGLTSGGIITPWGGMSAYTQGMVTRHQFFANTDSWKVAGTYTFTDYAIKASAYYTSFDIGIENTYQIGAWTATESGFEVEYDVSAVKDLNLKLRANYPNDFAQGLDWDEYRLIANYNF